MRSELRPTARLRLRPAELAFLVICGLARLALGLAYSQIVPPWESYDEPGHFQYARYLAKYRRLLQPDDPEAEVIWSKFQPPLYYALIAPALAGFDLGPTFPPLTLNPYLVNGNAGVNYAATPVQPQGLEAQLVLALRAGRALSGLISTSSLLFVYLTARRLWPAAPQRARAATALYAFWPQGVFIGSMLTNDLLVSALAAPILYLVIAGGQAGWRPGRLAALGGLLFAALLTKLNGLALIPAVLLALAAAAGRRDPRRAFLWLGGLTTLVLAAVALLSTMQFVTGQVFQLATLQRFLDNLAGPGLATRLNSVAYGFWTFFASYGWGNLETHPVFYWLWLAGALLALAGLVLQRGRLGDQQEGGLNGQVLAVLALTPLSLVLLTVALSVAQSDAFLVVGRYWLPALPSVVILLTAGLSALKPRRVFGRAIQGAALVVIGASWAAPFTVIAPAYARPGPMSAEQAAGLDRAQSADFGGQIRLLGAFPVTPTRPGQPAQVTVCWEALKPAEANYPVALEIVGPDGQGYGARATYPGRGNYPTRFWPTGAPFCDTYETEVWDSFPAPAVGALRLRLLDKPFGAGLRVTGLDGQPQGDDVRWPIIVRATQPPPAPAVATDYRFGDQIRLAGYTLTPLPDGRGLRVGLTWEAGAQPTEDYKVFVHLRDTPQTAFTQSDQRPRGGAYPTNAWAAGERVLDEHLLTWPAGVKPPPLTLYLGLYRAADGARAPIVDGQGQALPNNELVLPLP